MLEEGHFVGGVHSHQGKAFKPGKLASLGGDILPPREVVRADSCTLYNLLISIVNPNFSFSVVATVSQVTVTFFLDTGSALTIVRKDAWDQCKHPDSLDELSLKVSVPIELLTL